MCAAARDKDFNLPITVSSLTRSDVRHPSIPKLEPLRLTHWRDLKSAKYESYVAIISTQQKLKEKGTSVTDDNINSIFTYMRLCFAPHKRIYVATSVMLSCFTKGLFGWHCQI